MAIGHNPNTITSANSIILFRCKGVYDNWIKIEGAQADSFLSFGDVSFGETQMGVDGKQSIGFVPHETPVTLNLAANSPSINKLETVYRDFISNMEGRFCEFQVTYPSVKRRQTLKGAFTGKSGGTGIAKLLDGHSYSFSMISDGIQDI